MDAAKNESSVEEIARLVVEKLTGSGKLADLANANLLSIEEETIEQVDQITRVVINELLEQQSQQAPTPTQCPRCGCSLEAKKAQSRFLQSRRGQVKLKTDVFRCEACRLDFFPSDENFAVRH